MYDSNITNEKYEFKLYVEKKSTSGKAIYAALEEDEELDNMFWLPMSQINVLEIDHLTDIWVVEVPQWLAEEKGIM